MTFRHILVPVDFDETSDHALKMATELAVDAKASLTLLHTIDIPPYAYANFGAALPPPDMLTSLEIAARRALDKKLETVRAALPSAKAVLTTGVPWRQILTAIDEGRADLVVMGRHRRHGLDRALGSSRSPTSSGPRVCRSLASARTGSGEPPRQVYW
jgi:universal stress protein A